MNETQKRLKIINNFFSNFNKELFEAILLTGSMTFGKNYSIHKNSDIDLIFILKSKNITNILSENFFTNAKFFNKNRLKLFKKRKIDGFWCDQNINNIKINIGFCSLEFFKGFCNLKRKTRRIVRTHNNKEDKKVKTITGKFTQDIYSVKKHKTEFIWTSKIYDKNSTLIAKPYFGNLITSEILYAKNNTIENNLKSLHKKLIKTYGIKNTLNLLDYILKKSSKEYKKELIEKLKKSQHKKNFYKHRQP